MKSELLDRCVEVAHTSEHKTRVGAIALKKNRIISEATNTYKTHPVQAHWADRVGSPHKIHLHAEMRTLLACREAADGLIVARVDRRGRLRISKPCSVCQAFIDDLGINNVWYIDDEGDWTNEF